MDEQQKKEIDESYKSQVEKEKDGAKASQDFVSPEANFSFFVTTLGMQAAIALGDMPNPQSNKTEENIQQAKFIIDTLGMLCQKTKGNLSAEELSLLEGVLYELRMRYVQKASKWSPPPSVGGGSA